MGFLASGRCFYGDALHRAQSCGSPLRVPPVPALLFALRCTLPRPPSPLPPPNDPVDTDGCQPSVQICSRPLAGTGNAPTTSRGAGRAPASLPGPTAIKAVEPKEGTSRGHPGRRHPRCAAPPAVTRSTCPYCDPWHEAPSHPIPTPVPSHPIPSPSPSPFQSHLSPLLSHSRSHLHPNPIPFHPHPHPHPHPTRPAPHNPSARRGRSIRRSVVLSAAVRPFPPPPHPDPSVRPSHPPVHPTPVSSLSVPPSPCPPEPLRTPFRRTSQPPRGGVGGSGWERSSARRGWAQRCPAGGAGEGPGWERPPPFPPPPPVPTPFPAPRGAPRAPRDGAESDAGLRARERHRDARGVGLAWTRLTCARSSSAAGRRWGARCPPYPAIFSGAALIRVTHLFTRAGFLRLDGGWPSPLGRTTPRAPHGPAPPSVGTAGLRAGTRQQSRALHAGSPRRPEAAAVRGTRGRDRPHRRPSTPPCPHGAHGPLPAPEDTRTSLTPPPPPRCRGRLCGGRRCGSAMLKHRPAGTFVRWDASVPLR